ncbi:MAG TPA: hypothetical protein VKG92_01225 [Flavobacteriales bacterium]|nr:hypothetical protein [Flavobacteriales bacterium]
MQRLSIALSVAALIAVALLWFKVSGTGTGMTNPGPPQVQAPAAEGEEHEEEELEVAVYMGRIQRYHQKLWEAGEAGNTELATFYLHEIDEAMEAIADAHVVDDGVDVSANMRAFGLKEVDHLQDVLKKDGVAALQVEQTTLANTCNSCHVASAHPFIRIQVPTHVDFPDQDFAPAK